MPISDSLPFKLPQDKRVVCISNGWSRANEGVWQRKSYFHCGELIETILNSYDDAVVYLVGDSDDREWAEENLSILTDFKGGRIINACGMRDIIGTASLVAKSDFGIYSDTSVAHVADALKRPRNATVRA